MVRPQIKFCPNSVYANEAFRKHWNELESPSALKPLHRFHHAERADSRLDAQSELRFYGDGLNWK